MRVVEYRNGQWFDGSQFVRRPMYVAGEVFHERRPSRVDSVADLGGGYVVPPFADAHQHLYDPTRIRSWIAAFLRDGIYYVKDQSTAPRVGHRLSRDPERGGLQHRIELFPLADDREFHVD